MFRSFYIWIFGFGNLDHLNNKNTRPYKQEKQSPYYNIHERKIQLHHVASLASTLEWQTNKQWNYSEVWEINRDETLHFCL